MRWKCTGILETLATREMFPDARGGTGTGILLRNFDLSSRGGIRVPGELSDVGGCRILGGWHIWIHIVAIPWGAYVLGIWVAASAKMLYLLYRWGERTASWLRAKSQTWAPRLLPPLTVYFTLILSPYASQSHSSHLGRLGVISPYQIVKIEPDNACKEFYSIPWHTGRANC